MTQKILSVILICCSNLIFSQNDTLTFSIEQVFGIIKKHHPVVKLAEINLKKSNAEITIARGAFNPVISNTISKKTFANSNYYDYINPNITIPTWFGIEISGGIENLDGNRFDPSETIGESSYIGVSIPILKNLVIDKRRAVLKQSKTYNKLAKAEQRNITNNVLMEATEQYWEWVNAYKALEILNKNLINSQKRLEFIKKAFRYGERAAMDTIEAESQNQSIEFQKNESLVKFKNEGIKLSAFLWQQNNQPYQLPENIIPEKAWDNQTSINDSNININELISTAIVNHPEIVQYNQKIEILKIEKKLKFQELLPKLDFKYNHLSKGYDVLNQQITLFQDNYQYGVKFEMPLFLSKGRGEYKNAKFKIEETEVLINQKKLNIELKIKNYYNDLLNFKNQILLQQKMTSNFKKLLSAEETLFKNGESSIFLINSRESKVLEAERKLIEVKTKYFKTLFALKWSAGLLE